MSSPSGQSWKQTDWTAYYQSVPWTAHLTRSYTRRVLTGIFERYCSKCDHIIEFGGANSCFVEAIMRSVRPSAYAVVDTNDFGLQLLKTHPDRTSALSLHHESIFDFKSSPLAECAFSVGLIEHFDVDLTRRAVQAHFDSVQLGGLVIITFPTPTLLYRGVRSILEKARLWKFPDERPLMPAEVLSAIGQRGEVLEQRTLWPLLLTQYLVVARRTG